MDPNNTLTVEDVHCYYLPRTFDIQLTLPISKINVEIWKTVCVLISSSYYFYSYLFPSFTLSQVTDGKPFMYVSSVGDFAVSLSITFWKKLGGYLSLDGRAKFLALVVSLAGDTCKVEEYTAVAANDPEKDKKLQLKKDSTINVKFRSVKAVRVKHSLYSDISSIIIPSAYFIF